MGKRKKGRQMADNIINDIEAQKINIDINVKEDKYDVANALVLPSTKIKTKKVENKVKQNMKPLSKAQKKKLKRILESKQKKMNRSELLEKLQKVQVTEKELKMLTSTAQMQTKGLKRFTSDIQNTSETSTNNLPKSSIKGGRKKPRLEVDEDPIESSESDSENSEEDEGDKDLECNSQSEHEATESKQVQSQELISKNEEKEVTHKNLPAKVPNVQAVTNSMNSTANLNDSANKKPSVFIPVFRTSEIQAARKALPIITEEHLIMESINENPAVILCGETGSGKTTQVPQFLYEAGYASENGIIGITEPRRVAAISMSSRVAHEMNLSGNEVSYQIRFQGNVTKDTKIKFMTDGVLLKEIQTDFLLSHYSAIIIDEAHERSIYSDILIGLLSRIVPLRAKRGNPLKMIIMSATLRVEDFTENPKLFKIPPPIVKVESRQYPVTVHFNKKTFDDYLAEAYKKICKIHQQLPEGGILAFVTGRQEVMTLCRKLRRAFPYNSDKNSSKEKNASEENKEEDWDDVKVLKAKKKQSQKQYQKQNKVGEKGSVSQLDLVPKVNLNDYSIVPIDDERLEDKMKDEELGDDLSSNDEELDIVSKPSAGPLYVLPLFSLLSPGQQEKVFKTPPKGSRLCIVATNVAETSLTIPNVKYVVDTGKVKMRMFDRVTGMSAFIVTWTSKASANQRAGRAGRTGPGHCYRLYSSSVFNDEFRNFSEPEIKQRPVDDLVLQMKALGIDKVVNFPFPSPPEDDALKAAEQRLVSLGALEELNKPTRFRDLEKWEWSSKVTPLGRVMSCFPISPPYGKMLALSHQHNLLPYVVAIVSAMTVQEIFLSNGITSEAETLDVEALERERKWNFIRKTWAGKGHSLHLGDVMALLKAVGATEYVGCTPQFCQANGLRYKAMVEIRKLRTQLTNELNLILPDINLFVDSQMSPPSDIDAKLLRQVVLSGMTNHVARRIPEDEIKDEDKARLKNAYQSMEAEEPVFIHPKSVLNSENPPFVIYQEIFETSKMFMRVVSSVEPEWLPVYSPKLCTFSKPLENPVPRYDPDSDQVLCHMTSTFGHWAWPIPAVELEMPEGLDRYRWFCRFLLEGDIVPSLKKYKVVLLSLPVTMIKSWAKLQPRTDVILEAVVSKRVDSLKKLSEVWKEDSKFLLEEYCQWLPESMHSEVAIKWPPIT